MAALNTWARLNYNFVLICGTVCYNDDNLRTLTPVTPSTILYRIDTWLLHTEIIVPFWYGPVIGNAMSVRYNARDRTNIDESHFRNNIDHSISERNQATIAVYIRTISIW